MEPVSTETSNAATWAQLAMVAVVAASHMSMPNHWLPYSLVARAHSWTLRNTLCLTSLGAIGHATTTMIAVLAIFGMSSSFISHATYNILSTIILLLFGSYYLITYVIGRRGESLSCCNNSNEDAKTGQKDDKVVTDKSDYANMNSVSTAAAFSVISLTAFSPCVGSMPVLASLITPPVSVVTIFSLWLTLTMTAILVMLPLVAASFIGVRYALFSKIRKHERLILGSMLILLAFFTLFMNSGHHHSHSHNPNRHLSQENHFLHHRYHHHNGHDMSRFVHPPHHHRMSRFAHHHHPPHMHESNEMHGYSMHMHHNHPKFSRGHMPRQHRMMHRHHRGMHHRHMDRQSMRKHWRNRHETDHLRDLPQAESMVKPDIVPDEMNAATNEKRATFDSSANNKEEVRDENK